MRSNIAVNSALHRSTSQIISKTRGKYYSAKFGVKTDGAWRAIKTPISDTSAEAWFSGLESRTCMPQN